MDKLRYIIESLLDVDKISSTKGLSFIVEEIGNLNLEDITQKNVSFSYSLVGDDLEKSNIIQSNITMLSIYVCRNKDDINEDSIEKVNKLIDIISDECSKMIFIGKSIRDEVNIKEIREFKEKLNWKILKLEDIGDKIKDLESRLNNYNREYVGILGIFASVAVTFVGGITFSSSVLQNIGKVSLLRELINISLLGIVLSSILYLLFTFLSRIINIKIKVKIGGFCYLIFNLIMLVIFITSICYYYKLY